MLDLACNARMKFSLNKFLDKCEYAKLYSRESIDNLLIGMCFKEALFDIKTTFKEAHQVL